MIIPLSWRIACAVHRPAMYTCPLLLAISPLANRYLLLHESPSFYLPTNQPALQCPLPTAGFEPAVITYTKMVILYSKFLEKQPPYRQPSVYKYVCEYPSTKAAEPASNPAGDQTTATYTDSRGHAAAKKGSPTKSYGPLLSDESPRRDSKARADV